MYLGSWPLRGCRVDIGSGDICEYMGKSSRRESSWFSDEVYINIHNALYIYIYIYNCIHIHFWDGTGRVKNQQCSVPDVCPWSSKSRKLHLPPSLPISHILLVLLVLRNQSTNLYGP